MLRFLLVEGPGKDRDWQSDDSIRGLNGVFGIEGICGTYI